MEAEEEDFEDESYYPLIYGTCPKCGEDSIETQIGFVCPSCKWIETAPENCSKEYQGVGDKTCGNCELNTPCPYIGWE